MAAFDLDETVAGDARRQPAPMMIRNHFVLLRGINLHCAAVSGERRAIVAMTSKAPYGTTPTSSTRQNMAGESAAFGPFGDSFFP